MNIKRIFYFIKILIFIITLVYLYYEIILNENFTAFVNKITSLNIKSVYVLFLVIAGMILNWGVESFKWQFIIRKIYKIDFFTSFKAVISGLTISIWMPNRIGEYLGRILYVPVSKSIKVILCTIIGNIAQLITTILFGSVAFIQYMIMLDFDRFMVWIIGSLILIACLLSVFLYFNIYLVKILIPDLNKKFAEKARKYVNVFSHFNKNELAYLLYLSVIRYFIFTTQFYLLLMIFDIHLPVYIGFMLISIVFMVQSMIPSVALTEIGIRGAVSVYFIGQFTQLNQVEIIMSAYTLWLINIVIPALTGAFLIVFLKLRQT